MHRKFVLVLIFLVFTACNDNGPSVGQKTNGTESLFTFQGMPKNVGLSSKARSVTTNWKEFQDFDQSFGVLFNSTTNEDLEIALDNLLQNESALEKSSFPSEYNNNKIKSRLKVLHTFLLKAKADVENRKDATQSLKQLVGAKNALHRQFNLLVNNPINLDSLFYEN